MHTKIPVVGADEFSKELEEWCVYHDIPTHYDNDVVWVENDGNPFWQFLLEHGDVTEDQKGQLVAVQGT